MVESRTMEPTDCPFLRARVASRLESFPSGLYCRLPSGRIRILSRDELARFCTRGGYARCPVFRRVRIRAVDPTGLL